MIGLSRLLVAAAFGLPASSLASAQIAGRPPIGDRPIRGATVLAAIAVQPIVGRATNGALTLTIAFSEVGFMPDPADNRFAVTMHGRVPVLPTSSRMTVVARGVADGTHQLRIDFQKVVPAATVRLQRISGGAEVAMCNLQQNASYSAGVQSCSLTVSVQGGAGTLSAEITVETGAELVPVLVTVSQMSR